MDRGGTPEQELDDWLQAERELKAESDTRAGKAGASAIQTGSATDGPTAPT